MYTIPDATAIPTNLRDSLSCLDVVWSDMFETGGSAINSEEALKHEADYLKGAPPQWLNFKTPENSPFVERDGFKKLTEEIDRKKWKSCLITEVSLQYMPGSGGSTLAMQVLWHFRKDLRCARVIDSDLNKLPKQVVDLFLLSDKQHAKHDQKTVLLLLDTKENTNNDQPIKNTLWENLIDEIHKRNISTDAPVVIILNCKNFLTTDRAKDSVEISMTLSPNEKERFDQKRLELKEKHKTMSENFHAFNIMQGGFKKEDANKVITPGMVDRVKYHANSKSTRLFSFLALINSYLPGSHLSKRSCEKFLDHKKRPFDEESGLKTMMKPFMHLIVTFSDTKNDCIRMAHPMIADACLNMLTRHKLTKFNIAFDFLKSMVKGNESDYMQMCKRMLTKRHDTEKYRFSELILDLMNDRNKHEHCIRLLKLASELFTCDPFYPQALARLYYIEVNNYDEAESWAKKAIDRNPENKSHIMDTLGQVHKGHLRSILKKNTETVLAVAESAIKAFKEEECVAENELEESNSFNNRGLFGHLQVLLSAKKPLEQKHGEIIGRNVEDKYDFFEWYLAFSRPKINKKDPDYILNEVEECYKLYFAQENKAALNEKKMKSFGGLLHLLKSDELKQKQSAFKNPQSEDETQNIVYVLANIILSMFDEQSEEIGELQASLQKLWVSKAKGRSPEFYLLILLLFWFDEAQPRLPNPPDLEKCVLYMSEAYEKNYQKYLRGRYLVPLFFFGKEGNGLQRLVHSSKLLQNDEDDEDGALELLLEGAVSGLQRISGEVAENHKVFAIRDGKQIQVKPHKPASVYKQGQVSFYLGFSIRGPVAFNIRYTDTVRPNPNSVIPLHENIPKY